MSTQKRSLDQSWEEAGFSNNYIFRLVMENIELCKELLECLLDIIIATIEVREQEKDIETGKKVHGIRLDIYIKDNNGVVYDIEMQTGDYGSEYMAKRSRYYQSMLDLELLKKKQPYKNLKRTVIIFICTFDPFGYGLSKYTFENRCVELPAVPFDDESIKLFFNTKGNNVGLTARQKAFLKFVDGDVASDEFTRKLSEGMERVKQSTEKRVDYMTWQQEQIEQMEAGKEIGEDAIILKLLKKSKTIEYISDMLDFSIERVAAVAKANGYA